MECVSVCTIEMTSSCLSANNIIQVLSQTFEKHCQLSNAVTDSSYSSYVLPRSADDVYTHTHLSCQLIQSRSPLPRILVCDRHDWHILLKLLIFFLWITPMARASCLLATGTGSLLIMCQPRTPRRTPSCHVMMGGSGSVRTPTSLFAHRII